MNALISNIKGGNKMARLNYWRKVRTIPWEVVLQKFGYAPKRIGNDLIMKCIFPHKERTPSLRFYNNSRKFICYGCGKDGDVFDFVEYMMNGDRQKTMKFIAKHFSIPVPKFEK